VPNSEHGEGIFHKTETKSVKGINCTIAMYTSKNVITGVISLVRYCILRIEAIYTSLLSI
jgi:hypothetical protein